jgi:hypothetical protein
MERLLLLEWFRALHEPTRQWSLLAKVGSRVRFPDYVFGADTDHDFFLVIPRRIQEEHALAPVSTLDVGSHTIDVSLYSTERLVEDALTGSGVMHWRGAQVLAIGAADEFVVSAVVVAGQMTSEQRRRLAWSRFASFEIETSHAERAQTRGDSTAAMLARSAGYLAAAECGLAVHGDAENTKWMAMRLREVAPRVARELDACLSSAAGGSAQASVDALRLALTRELATLGFNASECAEWWRTNPTLLAFQLPTWLRDVHA